jgi:hypothetical protein
VTKHEAAEERGTSEMLGAAHEMEMLGAAHAAELQKANAEVVDARRAVSQLRTELTELRAVMEGQASAETPRGDANFARIMFL